MVVDFKRFVYLVAIFIVTGGVAFGQAYFSVNGWNCEARVDTINGHFGVGQYDPSLALTYEYSPVSYLIANPSSHVTFKIDGETYGWLGVVIGASKNLYLYNAPTYPRLLSGSNTIQNRWLFPLPGGEQMQIDQFLTPVGREIVRVSATGDSTIDTLGLIRVRYRAQNNGVLGHTVGIEHKWDIKINMRDDAPVSIPGSYADTNCVYESIIPGTFVAAEIELLEDLDQLIAMGIVNIDDATKPDFFAYGNETQLIPSCFNLDASFAGPPYSVTGVLIRWNPRMIPGGMYYDWVTYYGLGDISIQRGEITLATTTTDWIADSCRLAGNPKEFTGIVQNNSSALTTFDSLWFCIQYDSTLATLVIDYTDIYADSLCYKFTDVAVGESYTKTWLFEARSDTFGDFRVFWTCSTSTPGIDDLYDTTSSRIPYISGIGPRIEFLQPAHSFTACSTGNGLESWILFDETHDSDGVYQMGTIVRIDDGDTFAIVDFTIDEAIRWGSSTGNLLDTMIIFLDSLDVLNYSTGDTLTICVVKAVDVNGCESPYKCDTVVVDQAPPVLWDMWPLPGSATALASPVIQIGLIDSLSGIDTTKIFYSVDGIHYSMSDFPGSYYNNTTKYVMHSPVGPFPCETWVDVCIDSVADRTDGFCGPNWLGDTCWNFMVDCRKPTVEMIQPSNLSIISCRTPISVVFRVNDSTCVDTAAGLIRFIPGPTIDLASPGYLVEWFCDSFRINGLTFAHGAVRVEVSGVRDAVGNIMDPVIFNFAVDTLGPVPNLGSISPPPGSWVSPAFACSILVSDESPIADTSVHWRLRVRGSSYSYGIADINTSIHSLGTDNWLGYSNALSGFPVVHGDTVRVCLTNCNDIAELCGQNHLVGDSVCWDYYIDAEGPSARLLWPAHRSISACHPISNIDILVTDSVGVDPTTVIVYLNGMLFPVFDIGDTFRLFLGPSDVLPFCPDTVRIEVAQASDMLGNTTLDSAWWFIIDTIPPYSDPATWLPVPSDPILAVAPFDTISFVEFPGCIGSFSRRRTLVTLFVTPSGEIDSIWGNDDRVQWVGDQWNLPIPNLDYIVDSDTICIKITHLEDSLQYMTYPGCSPAFAEDFMDFDEWCIRISAGGPMITRRYPLRSYVSCPDIPNGFRYRIFDDDGLDIPTISFLVGPPGGPATTLDWGDFPVDTAWNAYPDDIDVTLHFDLEDYAAVGESVCVEFNRVRDLFGVNNEGVNRFCVVVDTTDPCPTAIYPDGIEIVTRTPLIWAVVPPDIAPLNRTRLAWSLDGGSTWIPESDPSGAAYWGDADTAFLDVALLDPSLWITGGDTVNVCIRNTDLTDSLVGCPMNTCEQCWSFWLAANGPIASALIPGADWVWACPSVDSIVVSLSDPDGIAWASVGVVCSSYVTGVAHHYSWPSGNLRNILPDKLIIIPDVSYTDEDTIAVRVEATDNLMNFINGGPFSFKFIIDHSAPEIIGVTPSCVGDSVADNTPILWFNAHDLWGTTDSLGWCIGFRHPGSVVDWDTICYDDEPSAWIFTGSTDSVGLNTALVTALSPWWVGGDTIVYTIVSVCDETDTCGPNCQSSPDTCYLRIEARGPSIANLWPDGNGIIGCEQPDTFIFVIYDTDEINTSSLALWYSSCSTARVSFGISDVDRIVGYRDGISYDTLYFVPPEVLAEGCYFDISIEALDMIGNNADSNLFTFVYDYTPPAFVIHEPFDSAFSFSPDVIIVFPDNIAGIDTSSVTVSLTYGPCAGVSATSPAPDTLEWRFVAGIPETLIFSFDAISCVLTRGDSACIHVDMACDNSVFCPACTTYDTTWCFEVVQGGPEAELLYPSGLLCPEAYVVFEFDDADSVIIDAMEFTINGMTIPYPGFGFTWDPSTFVLSYDPTALFDTTNIRICISGVVDGFGYNMIPKCWDLRVDLEPPVPTYISPTGHISDHHPDITIEVADSLSAIRPDCFSLTINGEVFTFDGTILSWTPEPAIGEPGLLVWSATLAGDTLEPGPVEVCLVEACDSTGCAENNLLSSYPDIHCWSFDVDTGDGPIVTLVHPTECGLGISCSTAFQFRWNIRDEEGVNPATIAISYGERGLIHNYDITSPELTLVDGDSTLIFSAPAPEAAGEIWITIDEMRDLLGNPRTGFRDTCRFTIDWDAPYVLDFSPEHLSVVGTPYPLIWFLVTDSTYILDYSSVILNIDGTSYPFADPHVYWRGDTVLFDPRIAPPTPFGGGDTIEFCIESLADSTVICPPNVLSDECWTFYVNADGPNLSLIFPDTTLDPMITFCDSATFWIRSVDTERLDTMGVVVVWNGDTVRWADSPSYFRLFSGASEDTVALRPPFASSNGDTVCLSIVSWPDSIGNNYFGSFDMCVVVDLTPPQTDWLSPADGDIVDDWSPDIFASLFDELSWINHDTIRVRINENGDPWGSFPWPLPELSWSGDTIHFTSDNLFTEFAEICVTITISDSTTFSAPYNCPPNDTFIEWCFTIADDDTVGPVVVVPDSCYVRANYDQFQIVVALSDPDGVYDDGSIDTTGQGLIAQFFTATTTYLLPMEIDSVVEYLGAEGDSLYWASTTPGAIPAADIISGMSFGYIIWSHDNDFDFDNPSDRQLSVSDTNWCVVYNNIPPEVVIDVAPNGTFVSCLCPNQSIVISLLDIDTLKSEYLTLEVNGAIHSTASPQITWDPGYSGHHAGTHMLTYRPNSEDCWEHSETVNACIRGVIDQWGNEAEDYCWQFFMDFLPPVAQCIAQADTNVDLSEMDSIIFMLNDLNSGVDPYEIILEVTQIVGGVTRVLLYDILSEPSLRYNPDEGTLVLDLRYAGGLDLSRDDSLFFSLAHTQDLSEVCDPNMLEDHYLCVKYIKPITKCLASPQPFTPPPPADGYNDEVVFDYPGRIDLNGLIKIYDLSGRQVAEITGRGPHVYAWDGYDFNGVPARPGVYVYVVEQGGEVICSGTVVLAR